MDYIHVMITKNNTSFCWAINYMYIQSWRIVFFLISDHTRPISVPEVSDFDEDLTSVKLRWMPTRTSPPFETKSRKYTIETWEPVRREWKPVARGVPDTSYQIRGLPKLPDHLFRVRMDTEEPALSEPSIPVSLSRYSE